jgi:hypothetical protein
MGLTRFAWMTPLACVALVACAGPSAEVRPEPGTVLKIRTNSPRVRYSTELPLLMSGGEAPERSFVVAASCRNVEDWMSDETLDNSIIVASNPRLVRVAELLDSGRVDPLLVKGVEEQFWRNQQPSLTDDLAEAGFDQADLDAYLESLEQPPSDDARSRYVVYAVSRTTSIAQIMYIAVTALPPLALTGRSRSYDLFVAVDGELSPTQVSESECPT